jgi:hypothetical protein
MDMKLFSQSITAKHIVSPTSNGVMVSPERLVNLSSASLTFEQKIRASINVAMRHAQFTRQCLRCENLILEAFMEARQYRSTPHLSYRVKKSHVNLLALEDQKIETRKKFASICSGCFGIVGFWVQKPNQKLITEATLIPHL